MSNISVENIKEILPACNVHNFIDIRGWIYPSPEPENYIEAPLNLSTSLDSNDTVNGAKIIFISAAGAVGKSTLAKKISS